MKDTAQNIDRILYELSEEAVDFSLPLWEELPDLELYMDQVITLITKYLSVYCEMGENERIVTPSMINNYVKLGIIPPPVKKRYSRVHLSYMLVVCTLKQTLDMSTIQRLMPIDAKEEETKETYSAFVKNQKRAHDFLLENIKKMADGINEKTAGQEDLILQIAASANIFKILTKRIVAATDEEVSEETCDVKDESKNKKDKKDKREGKNDLKDLQKFEAESEQK